MALDRTVGVRNYPMCLLVFLITPPGILIPTGTAVFAVPLGLLSVDDVTRTGIDVTRVTEKIPHRTTLLSLAMPFLFRFCSLHIGFPFH